MHLPPALMLDRVSNKLLLAAAIALVLLAACKQRSRKAHGALLVIAIDELRADHCSLSGYDRQTTPHLDALAAEGTLFDRAFSTAPSGVPAHYSLLTGCDPGVAERYLRPGAPSSVALRWRLPAGAPSFAEEMLRAGFATAAFVEDPLIGPTLGFSRGFQTFEYLDGGADQNRERGGALGRLEKWIAARRAREPWFAYVQLSSLARTWQESDPQWDRRFEPRADLAYAPPVVDSHFAWFALPRRRWSGVFATLGEYEARYDGALAKLDQELGRLVDKLRTRRVLDELTLVVVGAHGLSFGEGGLYLDSGVLTEANLRSLCVVRPASRFQAAPRGARIRSVASTMDLAPSLLEGHGAQVPNSMHGLSWWGQLAGSSTRTPAERVVFARFARQDGFLAATSELSYSLVRPWLTDPEPLARAWYGGPAPTDPRPIHTLVESAPEGWRGPREVSDPDEPRLVELRAAAEAWFQRVEEARRAFQRGAAGGGVP